MGSKGIKATIRVSFRRTRPDDFDYCARLYFAGMKRTVRDFGLDAASLAEILRQQWRVSDVRIVRAGGLDVGWFQTRIQRGTLFIMQLFIDPAFQGQGIGTAVLKRLLREAARSGLPMTLNVFRGNRALRLYERLGFKIEREDDRRLYLKRKQGPASGTLFRRRPQLGLS